MYPLRSGIKNDPERRWALPDRIFFGHGACHILAGVYLDQPPITGFHAERIIPLGRHPGNHIYVTDGVIAFDHHGYSVRERLIAHHRRVWRSRHEDWSCDVVEVDFCLLSTVDLNARKMLGPDQYLFDAARRARTFIAKRDHNAHAGKARALSLATVAAPEQRQSGTWVSRKASSASGQQTQSHMLSQDPV